MSKITIIEPNTSDKDQTRNYLIKGERGYSAYEIAVQNGYSGTEEEWTESFINATNYYNKTETDALLGDKADASTTLSGYGITDAYTKAETDNLIKDTYSTSEVKTNKVWIDNKPIYRKTIYISSFPTYDPSDDRGGTDEYNTGITNIETPINMYGMYYDTSTVNTGGTFFINNNFNYLGANRTINTRLKNDGTKITITYGNFDLSTYKGYVTIEYTKTTD